MSDSNLNEYQNPPNKPRFYISDKGYQPENRIDLQTSAIKVIDEVEIPELRSPSANKGGLISDLLRQAFIHDTSALGYIDDVAAITQSPPMSRPKSPEDKIITSGRPPRYQAPKPAQIRPNTEIQKGKTSEKGTYDTFQTDDFEIQTEEIPPDDMMEMMPPKEYEIVKDYNEEEKPLSRDLLPAPIGKPKVEKETKPKQAQNSRKPSRSPSPNQNPIREAVSKSIARMQSKTKKTLQDEHLEKFEELKKFYKHKINEKKAAISKMNDSKEEEFDSGSLVYTNKENSVPNYPSKELNEIDSKEFSSQIKKQNVRFSMDIDVAYYNDKFKSLAQVFSMNPREISEIESFKMKRDIKKEVFLSAHQLFQKTDLLIPDYVENNFDLRENHYNLKILMRESRTPVFELINFATKFEYLSMVKEMNENKDQIKKVVAAIIQLRRENNKMKSILKNEMLNLQKNKKSKESDLRNLKRTSMQENEAKLLMMNDIRLRLTQKNVVLCLKYLSYSNKFRANMINFLNRSYSFALSYQTMASLFFRKQWKTDRKKETQIARQHNLSFWRKLTFASWIKYSSAQKQKSHLYKELKKYYNEKLIKKGYYGILKQVQYRKLKAADEPIAERFNTYRLKAKGFLLFKFWNAYEKNIKARIKVLYGSDKGGEYTSRTDIADQYLQDFTNITLYTRNKLAKLLSDREYFFEPLKRIKTLLKPKYKNYEETGSFKLSLTNPLQFLNSQTDRDNQKEKSLNIRSAYSELQPFFSQAVEKTLVYKRKRYALDNTVPGNVYHELKEHLLTLISVRQKLENIPHSRQSVGLQKGILNIKDVQKMCYEAEQRRMMAVLFNKWKIAFLQNWTDIEVDLLHTMNIAKVIFKKFRDIKQEKKNYENEFGDIYNSNYLRKVFLVYKHYALEQARIKKIKLNQFRKKHLFRRWKIYVPISKKTRELYQNLDLNYLHNLRAKVIKGWKAITIKNTDIRNTEKDFRQKRVFKLWKKKTESRTILCSVFDYFIKKATHYVDFTPKNNFQRMNMVFKAWRNEVIENEHTSQQKINILISKNHRKHFVKAKTFRHWKKLEKQSKAVYLMSHLFKHHCRINIWNKWVNKVSEAKQKIANHKKYRRRHTLEITLKAMRRFSIQEQLIRCLKIKRFFLVWKAHNHIQYRYLPYRFHIRKMYQSFFEVLKKLRLKRYEYLKARIAIAEKDAIQNNRLLKKGFYSLVELLLRKQSKEVALDRYLLLKERNRVRKTFEAFKRFKYYKDVKREKLRLADVFRQGKLRTSIKSLKYGSRMMDIKIPLTKLALNIWRGYVLKKRNNAAIVERFQRFRNRIMQRKLWNRWFQKFDELRRYKPRPLPNFQGMISKYLVTDPEKMKKSAKVYEDSLSYKADSYRGIRDEPSHSSKTESDEWSVQKMRKNSEYQAKFSERNTMEKVYMAKYNIY